MLAQLKETKKFNFITYPTIKNEIVNVVEDSLLKKFIKIQLIDKKVFLEKEKTAVKLVTTDTTKIKKVSGLLNYLLIKG